MVAAEDAGVTVVPQQLTGGERGARLELDGVALDADRRLADGAEHYLTQHLSVALSALQLGVCEGALALTAAYARTREQFGRPIGSFQAVAQRLADFYIDVRGLRLTSPPRPGGLRRGSRRRRRSPRRGSGPRTPVTRSPTPRCTCTAVSGSTSTARRTATSPRRCA